MTPCSSNFSSACCTARFDPRAHAHVLMFPRSRHEAPVTEARHGVCAWFTTSRFTEGRGWQWLSAAWFGWVCLLHHACLGTSGPAARGPSLVSPVRHPVAQAAHADRVRVARRTPGTSRHFPSQVSKRPCAVTRHHK